MAFRSVAVPWLSGGLLMLGYAGYSWLRARRALPKAPSSPEREPIELLSSKLEHVPEEVAIDDEVAIDYESEPLTANNNAARRKADLGALFLGRASQALSPFQFGPDWPSQPR